MNYLKNSVTLVGNLGFDPETKEFTNGQKITRVRLATNEHYTNANGERVENTQWHSCVGFGKTGELMSNLLKKGKRIALQGKLSHRVYEDKEGVKRSISEVIVNGFYVVERETQEAA